MDSKENKKVTRSGDAACVGSLAEITVLPCYGWLWVLELLFEVAATVTSHLKKSSGTVNQPAKISHLNGLFNS